MTKGEKVENYKKRGEEAVKGECMEEETDRMLLGI